MDKCTLKKDILSQIAGNYIIYKYNETNELKFSNHKKSNLMTIQVIASKWNYFHPEVKYSVYISTENILFIIKDTPLIAEKSIIHYCFNKNEFKSMRHKT